MVKLLQKVIPLLCAFLFASFLFVYATGAFIHKKTSHSSSSVKSPPLSENHFNNNKKQKTKSADLPKRQDDPAITPAGPLSICPGGSRLLSISDAPVGATISWQKNNAIIPGEIATTYTVNSAGTYKAIVNNITTNEVTITSSPNPNVNFLFTGNGQCATTPVQFTDASNENDLTYVWDFGDPNSGGNNSSTNASPTHIFIGTAGGASQNFTVRLTVTTTAGCSATITKTVTMLQRPSAILDGVDLTTYQGEPLFKRCTASASSISFSNASTTESTNKRYIFQWGDNTPDLTLTSFSSAVNHTYSLGLYKLKLTVIGQNDCSESITYNVFVGSNPSIGLSNPGNTSICTGESLTFPINNPGTNPPGTKYTITFNDGTAPEVFGDNLPSSITHIFNKGSCGTNSANGTTSFPNSFSAAIEATNPCGTSAASVVPIYVSQKPTAGFNGSTGSCVNNEVTFTNTSIIGSNVSTSGVCDQSKLFWTITGPGTPTLSSGSSLGVERLSFTSSTSGSNNLSVRFPTPGLYTVQLKIFSGNTTCGTDVISKTICINPIPVAAFDINANQGCAPLNVKAINNSSIPTCGNNTYLWTVTPSTGVSFVNGTNTTSVAPELTFANAGSYTLTLTTSANGAGCTGTTSKTITVNSKPGIALNAAGTICEGASLQPKATITGTASSYQWTFQGGSPSSANTLNPGTVSYNTAGTFTTTLVVTNDCGTTTATNTVTVRPLPVIDAIPDQVFCNGILSPIIPLTTNMPGTTVVWTNNNTAIGLGSTGTGSIPAFNAKNTGLAPIVSTITLTAMSNGCTATTKTFKITVNPKPSLPAAQNSYAYCVGEVSSALQATPGSGNTLNWYTDAQLTNKLSDAPVPPTTTVGATKYYVTQTNIFGCESPAATVTVTVNPSVSNNTIGDSQTVCYNTRPAQLVQKATPTGGTGNYSYQWQASPEGTTWSDVTLNGNSSEYLPPVLTSTTYYRRIVSSGTCSAISNAVQIMVQGVLTNYNISNDQDICSGAAPALIVGQLPTGGNGVFAYQWERSVNNSNWQVISGETGKDLQPGALTTTTYYRRTTSSGNCSATSSSVTVNVIALPIVNAITNRIFCNGSTNTGIPFSSTSAGPLSYSWTNDNIAIGLPGSGIGNIGTFTTTNTGHIPLVGNISVKATRTVGSATCPGPAATFAITILPNITLQPIPTQAVCTNQTVNAVIPEHDATAFPGATVSFKWTVSNSTIGLAAGSGTQIPSFQAKNTGTTNVQSNITVIPVYNYNGQTCEGTPVSYSITVRPLPTTANAGADQRSCNTMTTLAANTPLVGVGSWSQTGGIGAILTNSSNPVTTVMNLSKGTRNEFKWTISDPNCNLSSDVMQIDVLTDIANTIKTDQAAICPGTTVTIQTDALTGGDIPVILPANYTYVWETSANGTSGWQVIAGKNSENITITPTSNAFYRRRVSSHQQCEVMSNVISVTLNATPVAADAGANTSLCNQTSFTLQGNDPGTGFSGTWSVVGASSGLTFTPDSHAHNAVLTGLQPGSNYTLKWTITNGQCGETSATVVITNLAPVTNTINVSDPVTCAGLPSTITGSIPTGGTGTYQYSWQSSTNNQNWSTLSGQTGKDLTFTFTADTYVRRTVNSGTCSTESPGALITVKAAVANNNITGVTEICTGTSPGLLSGSVPTGGDGTYTYQWQQSFNGTTWADIAQASNVNLNVSVLTQTSYYRRLVRSALCVGAPANTSNLFKVTVNPDAWADIAASNTSGCAPMNLKPLISFITHDDRNSSYEWFANGNLIGTGATVPAYTINADGETVVIKLVTTSKFGCAPSTKEITFNTIKSVSASFNKNVAKGCGPLEVNFTNTSQPLAGGTYTWNFGNGQSSVQAQPGPITFLSHPLNKDTTYVITLTARTSCGVNVYKDSVTVRPKPLAVFTPDKTIGCSPFEINITNQSRGLPNTYTFDFGNGEKIVKTDNSAFKYTYLTTKTDTLTLKLIAENECGKDSSFYKIVVYPNTVQANLVVNGDNKFGCAPVTVKFDNNSVGANHFDWSFGDGNTATTSAAPSSMNHTFTNPGVYVVKLTATNGCSTASTTQTITVYGSPVASFTANKPQYCVQESAAFNNTNIQPGYTYLWSFGDGTSSNVAEPRHAYKQAGKYQVKLTTTQSFADGTSCSGVTTHEIEIISSPVSLFTSNATNLNCAPFKLTTNTTPSNSANVEWNFGDPSGTDNQITGYSASHTYTLPGVYRIRAIAYNVTGCADTTIQTIRITERPLAAFSPGDTVFCATSETIKFVNRSTYGGTDLVTYRWMVNGTTVSSQKDMNYTFTPPATSVFPYTYKVTLIAFSTIGCPDTVSHMIHINAYPKAAYTVAVSADCAPYLVKITNTSVHADSYRWYLNNSLVSTDKTPTGITLSQSNSSYVLKLVVGNVYGCKTDSVQGNLLTYPKPVASFNLADSISCNGKLDVKITNNSVGANSYIWNFGDGTPEVIATTPSHIYGEAGIYKLRLIAFNGYCRDTSVHTIRIAAPVKAAFTAGLLKGCSQLTTTFQNASSNASSFLWDFGDGTYSTSKNPVHTYTYVGSPFTVKLIAIGEFGCADTTLINNYISVSAPPKADFSIAPDSVIRIPDFSFNFINKSLGNPVRYRWDFGDGKFSDLASPSHTYLDTGTYKVKLTVLNANGCSDVITKRAKVAGVPGYLFVPNAFEPGSGKRELQTFTVRASGLSQYSLRILNKWGELIWETTKLDSNGVPLEGWNGMMHGQAAPQGVYVWIISAKFINGTEWRGMKYANGSMTKTGPIHLIR